MLTLTARDAKLSDDFKGKAKEKDGESIPTLTFKLEEVELDENELGAFFRDPYAFRQLYNQKGDVIEPFLNGAVRVMKLEGWKVEGAYVQLTLGLEQALFAFRDCVITDMRVHLNDGGKTKLSFKVTTEPYLDHLPTIASHFGKPVIVEAALEPPGAQAELPAMNTFGEGEQSEQPKRSRRRPGRTPRDEHLRRGRAVRAAEALPPAPQRPELRRRAPQT